ncbi:Glycosyl transferase group 2 family protein [Bradyrhizobium sp.]|uniref:glycosyltransferase family 2 protein n=1 Tax=Bradyrhizobium sp. TaxID=376 RepID=UPI0007C1ECC3|nr:glycosyltransferase [Bradyrhizobium sp.]CUT11415.1 Glycosyl transferase group 2 family protein [Bradyrhizobium sp.]
MTGSARPAQSACGLVAIGRNEGDRLKRCLASARLVERAVYVDSGSSDGSVAWAREQGVEVVELDMRAGFTAARARNAGFRRLRQLAPQLQLVQFVDGDCELAEGWLEAATTFLERQPDTAAVFGRRRERHPERSIYNRICDAEWNVPLGRAQACGGDVMMRVAALEQVGGYRDDFIAGEEPELCVRLRAAGWTIWRIEAEMTRHDAAMTRLGQWWRRNVRSGYAFALGRSEHGAPPERLWVWESRRAWLWGIWLPLACALAVIAFGAPGLALLLIYPLQLARRIPRQQGALRDRIGFAGLELLGRFAEGTGQLRFAADRLFKGRSQIIEYK